MKTFALYLVLVTALVAKGSHSGGHSSSHSSGSHSSTGHSSPTHSTPSHSETHSTPSKAKAAPSHSTPSKAKVAPSPSKPKPVPSKSKPSPSKPKPAPSKPIQSNHFTSHHDSYHAPIIRTRTIYRDNHYYHETVYHSSGVPWYFWFYVYHSNPPAPVVIVEQPTPATVVVDQNSDVPAQAVIGPTPPNTVYPTPPVNTTSTIPLLDKDGFPVKTQVNVTNEEQYDSVVVTDEFNWWVVIPLALVIIGGIFGVSYWLYKRKNH